jgi:tetratricopeptide (TPR) repeat protein
LVESAPRGPGAQQIRLFDAVRAVLGRAAAAGIEALLLDDLHHADAASLEALRHAAAAPLELAWIVASRPVAADGASAGNGPGPGAWAELRATLAQLPQACEIGLMPLGVADVAQLVGTLAPDRLPRPGQAEGEGSAHELATRLVARTAGNPLFVLASLQAHWLGRAGQAGALPGLDSMASVSALMAQRLQTLSAPALALARCAAVAGQDFNAELAAAVLGEKPLALADAWAELQRAGVFGRNGFAHELIQEAARLTLPAPVAAALHAAVAERLLVEGQGKAERPARVAYHFEQTDRAERAAPHWHAAGHAAWARLRFAEATDCFEHAAQRHGEAGRVDAAYESAHAMRLASFEVDLGERSQTAVELLERYAHTPEQRGQAANERAVTLLHRGDLAGCEAAAHAGLLALGQAEAPLVRAELRRNVAAVALWRQQPGVALAELRAIEADVERAGDVTLRAHVRQSLSIVLDHCDQVDAAQEEGERAAALFLQAGHITSAAQVVANLAVIHHDTGRLAAAWAALERARSLVAGLPEAQRSYSSLNLNSGYVLTGLGEYERALGFLDEALAHAQRQTPGWLPLMLAWRAQLWLHLGLAERAQQDLASAEFDARTPPLARAKWLGLKAQLALVLHGRDASTLAALDDFATTLPAGGRRLSAWRLATAALPHRDDESAITHGRALLAELQGKKRFGLEMVVHAELAARLADTPRTARDHALAALALLDDGCLPDNSYRGRIWCQCLPLVREADPEGHATRLNAARAWIERSAAHTVPAMAVQAFLHRNPANQSLRSAAFGR